MASDDDLQPPPPEAVAIIGFAGRYPGAADIAALWANLRDGVESIRFFTPEELLAAGVDAALIARPDYVPAKGRLDDVELFDAAFFGYTPREATAMDPQQRLFLETAWTALENAGHGSVAAGVSVGVYASCSINTYLLRNWTTDTFRSLDGLELLISSDKDFLATRVAYKLDLRGPAVVVQTACSSSLSAVCSAAQALLDYQCDMALAGGVSVNNPRVGGYVYRPGAIMSPDGHCRAFDADAKGTVSGEGVGIVVLKRLSEAIAERDTIHAVIKGFALNNDGANKIGYTAPSVDGQAEVIRLAQAFAGLRGDDIGYVEAHGTGTDLGDPIEIAALTQAFRATTSRTGFCGIGSVKTNFGHTDAAAGVTGLLKATLALAHGQIPATLHYQRPNPHIDIAGSPFYVVDRLTPWPRGPQPRRAAVSAFGIGGTNAHAVLEEAPLAPPCGPSRPVQLLLLSARSEAALAQAVVQLDACLAADPPPLADLAHTLQVGRRSFDWRAVVACRSTDEARARLAGPGLGRKVAQRERPVVFAFSGQGAQYPGMGAGLYRSEPVFRAAVDDCLALLRQRAGLDLAPLLYPVVADEAAAAALRDTRHAQPALFVTEYALARLWMAWGVAPEAMIGHSIGEYVAACLAGVFALGDALELVAARGRLVASLPPGAMLAVPLAEKQLRPLLGQRLSIAAVNAPQLCVVSGETPAVDALEAELRASGLDPVRLHTSHAFHSGMLDPVLDAFGQLVARFPLAVPKRPYLSNVSGDWIRPHEATDPGYWVRHLRDTVLFGAGVQKLLDDETRVFLEVGPGASLGGLVRQQLGSGARAGGRMLGSLRAARDMTDDQSFLLDTLGGLWQGGVVVDWRAFSVAEQRRRVPLPTYPFERRRFWVDPTDSPAAAAAVADNAPMKLADPAGWLHLPAWQQQGPALATTALAGPWLVIEDGAGLGAALAAQLAAAGAAVQRVAAGPAFAVLGAGRYALDPACEADHDALFDALAAGPGLPVGIVHLAAVGAAPLALADRAFWSPLCTVRAAGRHAGGRALRLVFVSAGAHALLPGDTVQPGQALLAGPAQVARHEYPAFDVRWVDVAGVDNAAAAALLCAECSAAPVPFPLAWRGRMRWMRGHAPLPLPAAAGVPPGLAAGAVVLVTGGLGGIGLALARGLAATVPGVRLVLLGRSGLPDAPTSLRDQHRAAAVQALRDAGTDVMVLAADVADRAQLQAALAQARARVGRIAGVVHAAGLPAGGIIALKTRAAAQAILAPKVSGTCWLDELLADDAPDLFVLCSSLTASLGSAGQVDYTAANAFQDAFAQARSTRAPGLTLSIQWDTWRDSGMAVDAAMPAALAEMRRQGLATGLSDDEGIEVFRRVLGAGLPQVLVSTHDLARRLHPTLALAASVAAAGAPAAATLAAAAQSARSLSTAFVAPRNATERLVAAAWQDLFGIAEMGVHDNFFESDGHSLLAIQIVARLARDSGVKLPVNALFEAPTIAQIAERIDAARALPADDERTLAEALAMVEQLSDEDVARLLADADGHPP